MTDYKKIRNICEHNSRITERVVDDFLLAYAARHHGLEKKMNVQFDRYRHVTSKFERATVQMFKSQFIIHRVFRKGGLIGKFMRNPALERFKGEERDFLEQQASVPWRFSFTEIVEEPAKDFFRMRDVFSGDEYLLFSPSTTALNAHPELRKRKSCAWILRIIPWLIYCCIRGLHIPAPTIKRTRCSS